MMTPGRSGTVMGTVVAPGDTEKGSTKARGDYDTIDVANQPLTNRGNDNIFDANQGNPNDSV